MNIHIIRNLFLGITLFITNIAAAHYSRPPHIHKSDWEAAKPHFLPENHPIKKELDAIFQKNRAILSKKSMKKAGFTSCTPQKVTRIIVTTHPKLPGYIIKTHLDCQKARSNKPEEFYWVKRIEGAAAIKALISEKGWGNFFKVPKKWLYPLPKNPSPPPSFQRINFILVEEDMELFDNKTNKAMWSGPIVHTLLLDKVFFILESLGLNDCAKPDNIPFSIDGKIAFIDTQTHHEWPVYYKKMTPYLSSIMKLYWKKITKKAANHRR